LLCKPHKDERAKKEPRVSVQRQLQVGHASQEPELDFPHDDDEYDGDIYTDMSDRSFVLFGGRLIPTSEIDVG